MVGTGAVLLSHLALGVGTSTVIAGAAGVLFGAGIGVSNVLFVSVRQRIVPAEFLGRVASVQHFVTWGFLPLGALLGGWLAGATSLRVPYLTAAGLVAVVFIALARPLLRFPTDPILAISRPSNR